jgi:hypothetical protein
MPFDLGDHPARSRPASSLIGEARIDRRTSFDGRPTGRLSKYPNSSYLKTMVAVQPLPHPARRIDGGWRSHVRSLDSRPLQTILSWVSTIGARRAKVSAPGRRHERRLALVANSHHAGMEACAIAKAKRRPHSPWPTKERVASALELATAPRPSPDKAPRIVIHIRCRRAELNPA